MRFLSKRPLWALKALLVASVVIPALSFGLAIWESRQTVLREAEANVRTTVEMLHEHALKVFDVHEVVLDRMQDRVAGLSWEEIRRQETALYRDLKQMDGQVEQVGALLLAAPDGELVVSSSAHPAPDVDNADRGYFKAHRDGTQGTFVDQAVIGRVSGQPVFHISRALRTEDGRFNGVYAVAVRNEYFASFYATIEPELTPSVGLLRVDGDFLVRYPGFDPTNSRDRSTENFTNAAISSDEGVFVSRSQVDNIERIGAYKKLADYPVYAFFAVGTDAIMAKWHANILRYSLFGFPAALALFLVSAIAYRRARQEEAAHLALVEANSNLEARVLERTEDLQAALAEKEVLLKEVNHRVKNSLQVVSSLMNLERRTFPAGPMRQKFDEAYAHIETISEIHQRLYQSNRVGTIGFGSYLRDLCAKMCRALQCRIEVEAEEHDLPVDQVIPLALIVNELLTNAVKYAHDDPRACVIKVAFQAPNSQEFELMVSDNGRGLPAAFSPAHNAGLGMRLVSALVAQLEGTLEIGTGQAGARFAVTLPRDERSFLA